MQAGGGRRQGRYIRAGGRERIRCWGGKQRRRLKRQLIQLLICLTANFGSVVPRACATIGSFRLIYSIFGDWENQMCQLQYSLIAPHLSLQPSLDLRGIFCSSYVLPFLVPVGIFCTSNIADFWSYRDIWDPTGIFQWACATIRYFCLSLIVSAIEKDCIWERQLFKLQDSLFSPACASSPQVCSFDGYVQCTYPYFFQGHPYKTSSRFFTSPEGFSPSGDVWCASGDVVSPREA